MLPLLGIAERLHPELDEAYISNPDRTFPDPLSRADFKKAWTEVNAAITSAVENLITRQPTWTFGCSLSVFEIFGA